MFLLTFLVMSVHYLDWSYFKTQPQLFMVGMVIAFGLLHVLSILAAMLANEHALLTRNQLLEKEVRARAEELASTKEQLLESNKLATIGRMAGGIAHELNNPLAILSLNVEQLQRFAKKGILSVESVLKESSSIEKVISRIAGITSSLRNVARDNATDERRFADLRTVIGDTLPFCAERMKGLGIEFQTEMPAHACPIVCNSGALSQVTMNLLSNAIDAVADRQIKEIRLCLIQKENSFEISVEDSGILDQAILSSIMEPFFTTKPIGKGVGLGLSVSRSLAEAHSGKLYVDTTADRTRFVLTLPRLPEVGAQDV
ncbi:MAG TPA: hypothetical protein DCS07_11730 [Bdellovibrionales bacterium]|nr:hypothetical protein [Bdellovibrionales bacterium]